MYFKYSLEDGGEIITDGKQALARLQVKTEKLVKSAHHVELFSGLKVKLKLDGILTKKSFQIFNERNELIGSINSKDDYLKELWLEISDKLILKQKYHFSYKTASLQKSLQIRNESGVLIAYFERKFIWKKFRSYLFIVEKDLDKLIFEDRLFIYALGNIAQRILRS